MPDYIPGSDTDFNVWQQNFMSVLTPNLAAYGLIVADLAPLTTKQPIWTTALSQNVTAQAAANAATQAKDVARESYEASIRVLVAKIQANPAVTAASKAAAGITVPGTHATPSGPPTSAPVGVVETLNRLEHTIRFSDSATPTSRAKPPGVRGCQVWMKVGTTPPVSESDLHFLATDTRTPYVAQFEPADAGKTAYYWLRWENNKGETGPWSAPLSATITG